MRPTTNQLRVLLINAGAAIDLKKPLSDYQVPRSTSSENYDHFLTKMLIFEVARRLNYVPFTEMPMEEGGQLDLLLLPGPIFVQVETEKDTEIWQGKYYESFHCKDVNAEMFVIASLEFSVYTTRTVAIEYLLGLEEVNWGKFLKQYQNKPAEETP